ncbi:RND superfamily putative drug exporter [Kitasatospora herbaricolor]|uniref:MMPL family transporter n=1 Tax=Kitasatospora herbaricolor TaxID=68217 RepID=UPI0017493E6C|nr:MMPL family transporter [Kitasatospora herbaricolor]MDQ0307685.1 RND superfamily putative drug exporter [Kitasatospora herbaricolor]
MTTDVPASDVPASGDPEVGGRLAALGRFCFRHRRWVLGLWAVVLVVGVLIGGRVFEGTVAGAAGSSEADRGSAAVTAADPAKGSVTAVVDGVPVEDQAVRAAVTRATAEITALPGVASVTDTYGPAAGSGPAQRSADGNASLVTVRMTDGSSNAQLGAVTQRLSGIAADGAKVTVGGDLVLQQEVKKQTERDTRFGEIVTLPLTLVVMVLVFGGLAAASLPVIGAVASVGGALLAMFGFSKIMDIDTSVLPIATVLGLGLSIDYALLMVNRFREERGHGAGIAAAVERTSATAGRTVAFSGLTVAVALSGLFVFTSPVLAAVAAAGVSVVVIAVAAALTLVPALLGFAGRRIKTPTAPVPDEGFFSRTVRRVRRKAVPVALACTALLVAAGAPFAGAEMRNSGAAVLPASSAGRQVAEAVDQRFPQVAPAPVTVVVRGGAAVAQAYADDVVAGLPGVAGVRAVTPVGEQLSTVDVLVHGDPQGAAAKQVVKELRAERGGLTTYVTGGAASVVDFQHELLTRGPWALGLVAIGTLILLFLMTGSVVMPVKALLMNLLSLGASLGALTLIFQDGWFSGFLGFSPVGGLETFIPVLVFAFAFGLSMDYEVFLLARIKELRDRGYSCTRSVELGLQRSGKIITSAALLMVIVFAGFAAGDMLMVKQMGIALAVAVAVDATLVRCLLVPAAMTLFGEFNWWAPAPLRRLHRRFGLSEHTELPPIAAAVLPAQRGPAHEPAEIQAPAEVEAPAEAAAPGRTDGPVAAEGLVGAVTER